MKTRLLIVIYLTLSIKILFSIEYGIAIKGNLNVREAPSISGKLITKVKENHLLIILNKTNNLEKINNIENYWYKIKTTDGLEGYVFGEFIKKVDLLDKCPDLLPNFTKEFNLSGNDYIQNREKYLLDKNKENRRDGETLYLKLSNGKYKEIKNIDNPEREAENKRFHLLNYYEKINYYLIYISYYEWSGFMLVNGNNGNEYELKDIPVFNESYTKCVSTFVFDDRYLSGINFEIVKVTPDEIISETIVEISNELILCLSNPRWIKDDLIYFDRINVISNDFNENYFVSRSEIMYEKKWLFYQ